ncbi:helix-turn-helix domain-containing protein [Vibrio intestinalis]|uniref:helix-turn-helix domain-containing protein n=1 Tax=Vibrio intestinalis TaxID=2933291 RepID=UPI0021A6CA1F|nr:AraC family transcriptional regulator [Vibrio intestinalis]
MELVDIDTTPFRMYDILDCAQDDQLAQFATSKVTLEESVCDGAGYIFDLAEGMSVTLSDVTFKVPTRFKEQAQDFYGACLILQGEMDLVVPEQAKAITITRERALFFVCQGGEFEFHYNDKRTKFLNFCVPKALYESLIGANVDPDNVCNKYDLVSVTAPMVKVVDDIFRSKLSKSANNFYLQGKVMELLAILYHNLTHPVKQCDGMTSRDMDCIQNAARIIEEHMQEPPSLQDLARQVGINDNKLKRNFKLVFGDTVYGFLYSKRMAKASELLAEGELSVQEVANKIGFKHVGHFSKKFKEQYACSPKDYRRKSVAVG